MHYYRFGLYILLLFTCFLAQGQDLNDADTLNIQPPDTIQNNFIPDTTNLAENVPDSLQAEVDEADTVGDIETTIKYDAKDSLQFDYATKTVKLYGQAVVTYGEIKLEAAEIVLNWATNTVSAKGRLDTADQWVGQPVFTEGSQVYETKEMSYNFNTKKAVISGVVTQQGEAFMHAGKIKKDEEDVIYGTKMIYTTCNLPEPHFHIQAEKFKKLSGGATMVGPFHLRVNDIPTPVGFLFGMFPDKKERASGIVPPRYGEERRRGFFLRDGGYYFSISDYIDLSVLGEIYSKGSVGLNIASTYKKRYAYDGNFNLRYNRQKLGELGEESAPQTDIWLTWNHSPVQRGNSRFSASISAGTSSYNSNNPTYDFDRNIRQEFNSTLSFNKIFKGTPFSLGTSLRFNQNVATGVATLTFPAINLNMNRIYPFENLPGKSNAWYKKIFIQQDFNYSRKMSNRVFDEDGNAVRNEQGEDSLYSFFDDFGIIWRNAQTQQSEAQPLSFDFPISTTFSLFKYFTLSPQIQLAPQLYFKSLDYQFNDSTQQFDEVEKSGLFTAFTTSFSANLNTNIYGFYNPPGEKIMRMRHLITPEIRFSYTPDLSKQFYGFTKEVTNPVTNQELFLPRFQGRRFRGASGRLGFGIENNIEMKVKDEKDTTGSKEGKKIPLIEQFTISGDYDILADSFQLSDISIRARTRMFKNKVSINASARLDPYTYVLNRPIEQREDGRLIVDQRRISRFAWETGNGFGQISNANIAINANLNPAVGDKQASVDRSQLTEEEEEQLDYVEANPDLYVDFNIPWNLSLNYSFRYTKQGFRESDIIQSVRFNGDLNLTEKWKLTFSSGYEFETNEFVQTRINITRDLHCWRMQFSWVPFGRFQSYSLSIHAVSSLLQDLKIDKQRSWWDR